MKGPFWFCVSRLADRLGDPTDRQVYLLNMTARCGSTLVSQMVASGAGDTTRVMSEPWGFVHLHGLYIQGRLCGMENYKRLLRSAMRIQCKPENKRPELERIFLKMNNFAGSQFPLLKKLFPKFDQLFITRHPRASFASYMKLVKKWAPALWYWTGNRRRFFMTHMSVAYKAPYWWDLLRQMQADAMLPGAPLPPITAAFSLAAGVDGYLRTSDHYEKAILFEDLKEDPAKVMSDLFRVIGVSQERVPRALEALKEDSQQGQFGGRGGVSANPGEYKAFEDTLKLLGSPLSLDMKQEDLKDLICPDKIISYKPVPVS